MIHVLIYVLHMGGKLFVTLYNTQYLYYCVVFYEAKVGPDFALSKLARQESSSTSTGKKTSSLCSPTSMVMDSFVRSRSISDADLVPVSTTETDTSWPVFSNLYLGGIVTRTVMWIRPSEITLSMRVLKCKKQPTGQDRFKSVMDAKGASSMAGDYLRESCSGVYVCVYVMSQPPERERGR